MASEPSYLRRVQYGLRVARQETRRRPETYFAVILALSFPVGLVIYLYSQNGFNLPRWLTLSMLVAIQVELWVGFSLATRRADSNHAIAVFLDKAMAEEMYEFYLDPANQEPQGPPVQVEQYRPRPDSKEGESWRV